MFNHISPVHMLVLLSILISVCGSIPYIRNTISGKSKPNRVTWGMWALAAMTSAGAAIGAHADPWTTSRVFMAGFMPFIIFLVSFVNTKSYWKLTPFDFVCGIFSLGALIAWLIVDSNKVAVLLALAGDAIATLPTIIKAWKHPETETGTLYIASIISAALILPAIPVWNVVNSAFQIYLLIITSILAFAVYRKRLFSYVTQRHSYLTK